MPVSAGVQYSTLLNFVFIQYPFIISLILSFTLLPLSLEPPFSFLSFPRVSCIRGYSCAFFLPSDELPSPFFYLHIFRMAPFFRVQRYPASRCDDDDQ